MPRIAATLTLLLLAAPASAANAPSPGGPDDFPSLQGGESLRGSSAALGTVGFATLGVDYGQGMTERDDLGAAARFGWSTTELVVEGFWRRHLGRTNGWDFASRLALGWYFDGGSRLIHDDNLSDRGFQVTPGLAVSTRGLGLFSLGVDLPFTITTRRGGGTWIAPRLALSYETALYDRLAVGVRGSLAWRGGSGGAPMRAGQVLPELLVTATWRLY